MHIFLLWPNFVDNTAICYIGALGYFVPVDEKHMLAPCMSHNTWKRIPILLDIPLLHFSFPGPFIMCRYSWAFPILGQITALTLPGCKVSFPVAWSITAQSSPAGSMVGAGLLCVEVGVLMVSTWFPMISCSWIRCDQVLYLCNCGTLVVSVSFQCAAGGVGSVSSGMMLSAY